MDKRFEKYKGIHPGVLLERELKKHSIKQRPFALSINEHPQTFNAIIKCKRAINVKLALKIEEKLNFEEGTLLILQAYYDIKQEKKNRKKTTPNLDILRKSLFWDTKIDEIDWEIKYIAIIQRIFERGSETEQKEISRFYGEDKIKQALRSQSTKPYLLHKNH